MKFFLIAVALLVTQLGLSVPLSDEDLRKEDFFHSVDFPSPNQAHDDLLHLEARTTGCATRAMEFFHTKDAMTVY